MSVELRSAALEHMAAAVTKAQRSGNVAFPPGFVISPLGEGSPPLARMIQGGRGGEVRLRLYLCITMMATKQPYDLKAPRTPAGWARLLGLPPDTGPRRIASNLKWLGDSGMIKLTPRWGAPSAIAVLDPSNPGKPYGSTPINHGRYVGMPIGLWRNGWIIDLSATALALLFALLEHQGGYKVPRYVTTERRSRYGLSHGTWTRARAELEQHQILQVTRVPQGSDFDYQRMRNAYWIDLDRLSAPSQPEGRRPG
ncbi:hypothetical protein [Kitasatospora purpeofusca]|uniref:hypothetical protein n=1 Tax=Kitasatospora purpeofusca TaxID=67352 RepID=UPI0038684399|nr:hypothetical protein OIP63_16110 [Kitasatospora purpeofusca]